MKRKHRLLQIFIETKSGEMYKGYAKARNQVKGPVQSAMRRMEKDIAKNAKTCPIVFFAICQRQRQKKGIDRVADLKYTEGDETKLAEDGVSKAHILADLFKSVFILEPDGELPEIPAPN